MSDVECTPAGLQMIIPGCERRTLPRSITRVDEADPLIPTGFSPNELICFGALSARHQFRIRLAVVQRPHHPDPG